MDSSRIRVQLDFAPDALKQLDQLREQTMASSRADTVRFSLRILQWVMTELQNGGKIMVEKDGKLQEIVFPFLPRAIQDARRLAAAEYTDVATSR